VGFVFAAAGTKVPALRGWCGEECPLPMGRIFYAEMVHFSADLITGIGLVVHCREHYLWLSLENWLKLSAESISIQILLPEIRVNQMTRYV